MRVVLPLVLLLVACGSDEPARPAPSAAQATLERFRDVLLKEDWSAAYDLYAPSERKRAEGRWNVMRADADKAGSPNKSRLDGFALDVGKSAAEVAAMDLRTFFVLRNKAQGGPRGMKIEIRDFEELEGDFGMARVKFGDNLQQVPMKREDGRWYLARTLDALTDF